MEKNLLHYEIESHLGAGGMGDVYQARDTKLGRSVAIKILPEIFARDEARVARFEREAKVLASLNHPHIAALYGFEQSGDKHFLIMELVDGETLSERIRRGSIPVEEALRLALETAEALEAAHEKGVIHRDLKPSNVKITSEGKVKVLDFGLAKALEGAPAAANPMNSPTLSMAATNAGVILGTAGYMSPEQAKGQTVDHRSDIFSFGCVLYEMLTGRQTFEGDSVTEVIASVLKQEPDLARLPHNIHPRVVDLLRRCLAKDVKRRWHAVADVRVEIETILAESRGLQTAAAVERGPLWKRMLPAAVTGIVVAAVTAGVVWNLRPAPAVAITRFTYVLPDGQALTRTGRHGIAISPNGANVAYVADNQLYLRAMSDLEARPLQGTAQDINTPFFSPDGLWVGFYVVPEGKFKKVAITGGAAVTICETDNPYGANWVSGDVILFGQGSKGIMRVSANGGKPETVIQANKGEFMLNPQLLPDGEHVLYTVTAATGLDAWDKAQIAAQSLESGERKVLFEGGADARYVSTGHLVYALESTLLAVPFDAGRLAVTGGPVPLTEDVMRAAAGNPNIGAANFAISSNGTMAYIVANSGATVQKSLVMVDRSGQRKPLPLPPGRYLNPRISPDGKQLALHTDNDTQTDLIIWIYDLSGTTSLRRLTFEGINRLPLWTRDSQRLIFRSNREKDEALFWQRADGNGAAERLTKPEKDSVHNPFAISPDGKTALFQASTDIWSMALDGQRAAKPLIVAAANQVNAAFSPDGKWVVYVSNESGRGEIYVQPFPPTGTKYQVTTDGGGAPLWSPDGKQIFYLQFVQGLGHIVSVDVRTEPSFGVANPAKLPVDRMIGGGIRPYDITPDGKQFIVMVAPTDALPEAAPQPQVHVTLNWTEELKQRVR